MTAIDTPPPAAPAPVAPATPAPAPAAPAIPADYSSLRVNGASDDTVKGLGSVFGKHKVDPKVAQSVLDEAMPLFASQREAADKAMIAKQDKDWAEQLAKDPGFAPGTEQVRKENLDAYFSALPENIRDATRKEIEESWGTALRIPSLAIAMNYAGALIKKATANGATAVGGAAGGDDAKGAIMRSWAKSIPHLKDLSLD